jgi:argininosuccinate lyase
MLSEIPVSPSIVTKEEAKLVKTELAKIIASAEKGDFTIEESDQDVHMAVERRLTETLGSLGKKIHTGRSRNDQVAVDVRLHIKDQILSVLSEITDLAESLVNFGKKHDRVPMVGRTHLQPAMPSSIGVWATGHAEMILDQVANIEAAYKLNDACPLGSAAGYGVPLPLNRERTSSLLGFERPLHNVFGASMARGENESALLCALAQLMSHLSRIAQDVIIFSMPEFGYFTLPRQYCTGSSIMPQKYNPDVMELVRSKTAIVLGLATASLSTLHAMPGGYNRDLQDSKGLYMKGISITRTTLRIMAKFIDGMGIDEAKLREGFIPGVFATDVALRKVAEGMPWREAYHSVRDNLEALSSENPDDAVAAKTHAGATAGLDWELYDSRISTVKTSTQERRNKFNKKMEELLG